MDKQRTQLLMAIAGAFVSWIAVVLQLFLMLENRAFPFPETIVRFFSYYTILTNLLVACCFTGIVLKRKQAKPAFFADHRTLAATAVYITIVGAVYNTILRHLWAPEGLQFVVDELLHTINPLYYLAYWTFFAPKEGLKWAHAFPWLIYPLAYFIFILTRGSFSGFYPYPFIDVAVLGWGNVLLNSAGITAAFVMLSLTIIAASKVLR